MRTILGLLPKYAVVDKILISSNNCALHLGLYKVDETTLQDLRKVILLIRKENVGELQ